MISKLFVILMFLTQLTCEPDKRVITTLMYSRFYVEPTIVNGEPAVIGQVPYLVSIKEPLKRIGQKRIVWKNLCGGSIIHKTKVLTAAHCFEGYNFYYKKNPSILRLVAGNLRTDVTHSGTTETSAVSQWRQIAEVVLHKNFNFPDNDIALVFVNEPWKFTSNVDYAVPATKNADYLKPCMSAGFGRVGYGLSDAISPILLVARIKTMSKWRCSRTWEMNMNTFICTESLMADVSRGDSGGPLSCKDTSDPKEEPNRDLLVGVVSGKNFDKTTLYTRVSAYHDWIARNIGQQKYINVIYILITYLIVIYQLFFCSNF